MRDELGRKIMKEFAVLRAKTYNYLKDNNNAYKKARGTKKMYHKKKLSLKIITISRSDSIWK